MEQRLAREDDDAIPELEEEYKDPDIILGEEQKNEEEQELRQQVYIYIYIYIKYYICILDQRSKSQKSNKDKENFIYDILFCFIIVWSFCLCLYSILFRQILYFITSLLCNSEYIYISECIMN